MTSSLHESPPATLPDARWLRRAALATAILVFPLIFVGAGVTSRDAGMAFPDAPLSNGALLNPDGGDWIHDPQKLWEHGHRLIGWTVGMSAIVSAVLALRGSRRAARILSPLVLLAIIAQGVMGWKRVWYVSTVWAMLHGVFGQICFCLACVAALVATDAWARVRPMTSAVPSATVLRRLCLFTTVAVFVQLVMGAALRHFGGGHALVAHVLWAIVVVSVAGLVSMWVVGQFPGLRLVAFPGKMLGTLTALQLILGGASWLVTLGPVAADSVWAWLVPTAHVAIGALVLVSSLLLTIAVYRVVPPALTSQGAAASAALPTT
jgi:cytochrome c oxidase assembly protein subunit 15